jgi:hypothetical protein
LKNFSADQSNIAEMHHFYPLVPINANNTLPLA